MPPWLGGHNTLKPTTGQLVTAIYPTYQGEKYQVAINFKNIHLALEQWPEVMRKGQGMETQCLRKTQGLRDQKRP